MTTIEVLQLLVEALELAMYQQVKQKDAITTGRAEIERLEKCEPVAWEIFRDECYFDLWAVRLVGEKRWGYCYHVPTKEEAEALAKQLSTPAHAIPEGWQLVPKEPTDSMVWQAVNAMADNGLKVLPMWKAMLQAAPKPEK